MEEADQIIDIGPGAGEHGGEVVFSGTPSEIVKSSKSITGQYLSGKRSIEFSTNSLTTWAGLSTTSPAAILSIVNSSSC